MGAIRFLAPTSDRPSSAAPASHGQDADPQTDRQGEFGDGLRFQKKAVKALETEVNGLLSRSNRL
ncbi:MAG: hypothetical protein ACP5D7_00795 [Limnospira sp.]